MDGHLIMARVKLTAGRVRDFKCGQGAMQSFLWDTEAPGLAVRITSNGAKAYVFQSKLKGKTIRITIGDVRTWDIESGNPERPGAREQARHLQSFIDKGIDPRQEKEERIAKAEAKREEASRLDITVADAWATYVEARKHKWSPRHLVDHEKAANPGGRVKKRGSGMTEPGPLATLMPVKLGELTPARVEEWLKQETDRRPTYAALSYRLLRAFIRWASGHPDYAQVTHVEAVGTRVAKDHVPRAKAKEGDSLQREQLAPWFKSVREIGNPVISAYLQTLLLTGARREELAGLTWADTDFQWKSLTIRDKVDGERVIPLTPYVTALLNNLPRRKDAKGKPLPWVFSSLTAANGRLQEPRVQHVKALTCASLPHVTLHGLRRSFGTLAEWTEAPVGIVAQIMGHKPSALAEKHYRRRPLDLLRMWHTKIEAWILEQAGIAQPTENSTGLRLVKIKHSD